MRVSAPASIITWCCAVFCYVAVRSVDGLSTKISAGGFECFSEVVSAGASLSFTFQVIGGGDRDVDVVLSTTTVQPKASDVDTEHILTSQNHVTYAHILQSWTKSTDGEYILTAPLAGHGLPTKVKACFNNQFSRLTPKWVSFSLVAQDVGAAFMDPLSVRSIESELEHALHQEATRLFEIRSAMHKVKQAERHHRDQVEGTNEWMFYGTVVNGVMLIVMAVFQFWYLRRFLSVGRPT